MELTTKAEKYFWIRGLTNRCRKGGGNKAADYVKNEMKLIEAYKDMGTTSQGKT
ncbi:hypothetical protein BFO01nite_29940 [Brevibacillus formosus]|uniref:Uncharacterized protein n=1 Tax=Brevibacillus formosus TaxID=54913 RepID=A0ABQ0T6G9_9BACL|nr:hypothetical protein BFO01nite_29940 [Brevibacillus formosus]